MGISSVDQIDHLIMDGELEKALDMVNQLTDLDKRINWILKAEILFDMGNYKDLEQFVVDLEKRTPPMDKTDPYYILLICWKVFACTGDVAVEILWGIINNISFSQLEESQGLPHREDAILLFYRVKAHLLFFEGKNQEAIYLIEKSKNIELRRNVINRRILVRLDAFVGVLKYHMGDLEGSLEAYNISFDLAKSLDYKYGMANNSNNIGEIYRIKGQLKEAEISYSSALKCYKALDNKAQIYSTLHNLGLINFDLGKRELAAAQLEEAFWGLDKINELDYLSFLTPEFVRIILMMGKKEKAERVSSLMEKKLDPSNRLQAFAINLTKALVLKNQDRLADRVDSERILRKLIEETDTDFHLYTIALLSLGELLVFELKIMGSKQVYNEVMSLIEQIRNIANQEGLYPKLVRILILEAKLAIVDGKFDEAKQIYEKALQSAQDQGLHNLVEVISTEKRDLDDQFKKMEEMISKNSSFRSRMETINLDEYLNEVLGNKS